MSRLESPFRVDISGASHIGGKRANEDHYRYDDDLGLLAVASGVSTLRAPRIAAETAIGDLFDHLTDPLVTPPVALRDRLERALAHVHRSVREQAAADENLRGMAAAMACVMEKGRLLIVGHVGDCRVVRIREGQVERLTTEHRRGTDPMVLSAAGAPEGNDPRALTRAIGLADTVAPDVSVEGLREKDSVLLATAGLMAAVDEQTLLATVQRGRNARHIVNELIQYGLSKNGPDSLTCIFARWQPILP